MGMFRRALFGAALFTLATSASPLRASEPTARPALFSWTGLYVGLHAGGGWADNDYYLIENNRQFNFGSSGGFAGGYVGYNFQLSPLVVVGVEAEGSFSNIEASGVECTIAQTALCSSSVDSFGSIRARFGVLPTERILLYVAGGWGFADLKFDRQFQPNGIPFTSGVSDTRSGGVVGAGLEIAFSQNWLARVQWDHYYLGSEAYPVPALSNVSNTRVRADMDTVRVGLSYKFGY